MTIFIININKNNLINLSEIRKLYATEFKFQSYNFAYDEYDIFCITFLQINFSNGIEIVNRNRIRGIGMDLKLLNTYLL